MRGILFCVIIYVAKGFTISHSQYAVITPYFRVGERNEFTPNGWAKLVEAVKQRNSTKGMSQLELIGSPTVESDEESDDGGEQNN